eukprot:4323998-Pleurochrysis_carterae.AAC.1
MKIKIRCAGRALSRARPRGTGGRAARLSRASQSGSSHSNRTPPQCVHADRVCRTSRETRSRRWEGSSPTSVRAAPRHLQNDCQVLNRFIRFVASWSSCAPVHGAIHSLS